MMEQEKDAGWIGFEWDAVAAGKEEEGSDKREFQRYVVPWNFFDKVTITLREEGLLGEHVMEARVDDMSRGGFGVDEYARLRRDQEVRVSLTKNNVTVDIPARVRHVEDLAEPPFRFHVGVQVNARELSRAAKLLLDSIEQMGLPVDSGWTDEYAI